MVPGVAGCAGADRREDRFAGGLPRGDELVPFRLGDRAILVGVDAVEGAFERRRRGVAGMVPGQVGAEDHVVFVRNFGCLHAAVFVVIEVEQLLPVHRVVALGGTSPESGGGREDEVAAHGGNAHGFLREPVEGPELVSVTGVIGRESHGAEDDEFLAIAAG